MRISDLSRQTGVPVATIKFYLRERLLPPGTPTGRNQAQYGDGHRRRLRLIRTFTHIGQLDLSSVRELLAAIEDDRLALPGLFSVVNGALFQADAPGKDTNETRRARADVDRFIDRLGWQVDDDAPGRNRLVQVLAAMQRLGCDCGVDFFRPYAEAAEGLAARELDLLEDDGTEGERAAAVARAVLLDVALSAMRRMAQEHLVAKRFDPATTGPQAN